ncbi:MAG: hypothetical protein JHD16_01260 [Solirubrobacteraceae bacterium]|nr:hypothetical protein [Solirubrobacteraceae bacterium]
MQRAERARGSAAAIASALLLAVGVAAWVVRAEGSTDVSGRPAGVAASELADEAASTADAVVDRYALLQRPDGSFPDPVVQARGDYGAAMLGLAMLRRGHERRDGQLLTAGALAVREPAELPTFGVFELLAVAQAYGWGEQRLLSDPFAIGAWSQVRPAISSALSTRGSLTANPAVISCLRRTECYGNQKLVAGLAAQALLRTRLSAARGQALLADPAGLRRRVDDVARRVAVEVASDVARREPRTSSDPAPAGVLSDPPRNPLAYHALSVMLLGELVDGLGSDAPVGVRAALDRAGRALLRLAAPDGDLSYYGRGQGQVWVPAVTVAAAARVAERATTPAERGAALAVAAAALRRLQQLHAVGRYGLALVPGAGDAASLSRRGVDSYVSTRSYNGLAVAALDAAAPLLRELGDARATVVPSARPGATSGGERLRVLTLTGGKLWAAISTDSRNRTDARYGPGLLSVRRRGLDGSWAPVVPEPAMSANLGATLTVLASGRQFVPHGLKITPAANGSAWVQGTWRDTETATELPGTARWRWSIAAAGSLTVTFPAPCTCRVALGARLRGDARTRRTAAGLLVADQHGRVRWSLTARSAGSAQVGPTSALGASAYEPELVERRLTVDALAGEPVTAVLELAGR